MEKNQIGSVGRSSSLHEVRQIVDQAIRSRLQHSAPDTVLAVEQRDDEIYVAVNSGGNLIACSNALLLAGWRAVPDDEYVGYGCAMRVTRRSLGLPVCRRGTPLASCPNEVVRSATNESGSPHLSGEQSLEVGWTADAETRAAEEGDALTYVDFTFP